MGSNGLPITAQALSGIDDRLEMTERHILSIERRLNEFAELNKKQSERNGGCVGRKEEQVILIENTEM